MSVRNPIFLQLVISVALATLLQAAEKPNIVIVFTDDQGYGDLACYGSEKNRTPRLDQLAKEGTRFTSFYSQTVCGPSRSALLTGRQPLRSKGWGMPASEITWAELIRKVGYQTACIGKWDVSNRKAIIERMPNAQGFDYYFGPLGANDAWCGGMGGRHGGRGRCRDGRAGSRRKRGQEWVSGRRALCTVVHPFLAAGGTRQMPLQGITVTGIRS